MHDMPHTRSLLLAALAAAEHTTGMFGPSVRWTLGRRQASRGEANYRQRDPFHLPLEGGGQRAALGGGDSRMLNTLLRNQEGAAVVEYTIVFFLLMLLTFGIVEFGYLFWQWNSAEKATQMGVHKAVLTSPITPALAATDCGSTNDSDSTLLPGTPCPANTGFGTITCTGATATTASCSGGSGSLSCNTAGCNGTAFNWILTQMQAIFPNIQPTNVRVVYTYAALGFKGRGSPVPAVTVELTGMTYNFVALNSLLGFGPISMPDFRATLTAEDMNSAG